MWCRFDTCGFRYTGSQISPGPDQDFNAPAERARCNYRREYIAAVEDGGAVANCECISCTRSLMTFCQEVNTAIRLSFTRGASIVPPRAWLVLRASLRRQIAREVHQHRQAPKSCLGSRPTGSLHSLTVNFSECPPRNCPESRRFAGFTTVA
jgi:hypothetical protein